MSQIAFPRLDDAILARRDSILDGLAAILPRECLITDESGRRAFETDALTAYRRVPLAVALPRSTQEVQRVMRFCRDQKVNVVPRGAGTSLSGGAIPQEDAVVIAMTKMSRILEINLADRYARVEAGVTNLAISDAVGPEGFFYAPDPSSQLACTIGGNVAMNSGGAHCLKYGVTTNNLLGVRLVTVDGEILDLGGPAMDAAGYDFLGLVCGSEGQLGIVTEATVRLIRSPEGARPVLFGFDSAEDASQCVAAIIGAGIVPVAMEYMDKPAIHICENFAHAGYPLDVEAMLIIEVEGSEAEMAALLGQNRGHRQGASRAHGARIDVGDGKRANLEGPQIGLRRDGPGRRLYLHGRNGADRPAAGGAPPDRRNLRFDSGSESPMSFMPATATCIRWSSTTSTTPREAEKAEAAGAAILEMCVELGGCLTGEHGVGIEKRELMAMPIHRDRARPAEARPGRVRSRRAPQSREGVSARRARRVIEVVAPERESEVEQIVRSACAEGAKLDIVGGDGPRRTRASARKRAQAFDRRAHGDRLLCAGGNDALRQDRARRSKTSRRRFAEQDQILPFEPMRPASALGRPGEPTIGGMVATNLSGPRRLRPPAPCATMCWA